MKTYPLISIIVTNYNYGQYVTKAIESILNQTYKNIELIIINDGSVDNSNKIITGLIKKNLDKNIRYINHRENKGIVYTRNEGMEVASGDYLCYLDADDYFNNNYINKSYRIAQKYDADIVYPNWHFVGEWLGRPDTNFPEFKPELLQLQKLHVTPASLIRKSIIKNHRFEAEKVAEDWDFFIGLSLEGAKFKLAKDSYINYRIRKGTRGSKNDPRVDTEHFVEILDKYRAVYGDKVISSARLVSLRHPNFLRRLLTLRLLRVILQSLRNDGVKLTVRKILARLASRIQVLWKTIGYIRNKRYQKILGVWGVETSTEAKLAIVVHLYYPDMWPLLSEKLAMIDVPYDLFVSVQDRDKDTKLKRVNKYHKSTNIIALPNRGRDVLPFILIARKISELGQYQYLLKLHTKKSPHRTDGNVWLESLLDELIPQDTRPIINTLEQPNTGAIGPANHIVSLSRYMGGNRQRIISLIVSASSEKTVDTIFSDLSKYPFFGGTMFWCRMDFLQPLLSSYLTPADFNTERGQVDATTAHAIERVFGKILHEVTNRKMYMVKNGQVDELPKKSYHAKYKYVG